MVTEIAAYIFTFLILGSIIFQFALALGAPWGHLAMGGRFPDKLPIRMRIAALLQACVLALLAVIVLAKVEIGPANLYEISETAIWLVLAISILSLIVNLATPSKWERIVWAPVAVVLTICSLYVALG